MFCPNCGSKLNDGEMFCPNCGIKTEIQAEAAFQADEAVNSEVQAQSDVEMPEEMSPTQDETGFGSSVGVAETENQGLENTVNNAGYGSFETPASSFPAEGEIPVIPKKGKKKIIIGSVAAVVTALTLTVALSFSTIANAFNKLVMSDEKYFQHVENKAVESVAESFSEALSKTGPDTGIEGNLTLKIDDEAKDLIGDYIDDYLDIDWLSSIGIGYTYAVEDDVMKMMLSAKLNEKDIVSIDKIIDYKEGCIYLPSPTDEKKYCKFEMPDEIKEAFSSVSFNEIMEIIPDGKLAEEIICRYAKAVLSEVGEVEESKEKVTAGGVSQKCTYLLAKIDEKDMYNIAKRVLTELKDDKSIKKIIEDFASKSMYTDANEAYSEFVEDIENTLENLSEDDFGEDLEFEYGIYVDSKGDTIGADFEADGAKLSLLKATKGKKFGIECAVDSVGMNVKFSGSGKISGGKHTGDFSLSYNSIDLVDVSVKDYKIDLDKNKACGSVKLSLADGLLKMISGSSVDTSILDMVKSYAVELVFDSTKDKSFVALNVLHDDKTLVSLTEESKRVNDQKISIPSDIDSSCTDIEAWAESFDVNSVINALKEAGMPSSLIDDITRSSITNGYDNYGYNW